MLWKDLKCPYPWSHGFTFQGDGGKLEIGPIEKVREAFFVWHSKGLSFTSQSCRGTGELHTVYKLQVSQLSGSTCTCRGYQALMLLHGYLEELIRLFCELCSLLKNSGLLCANLLACKQKNMFDLSQL